MSSAESTNVTSTEINMADEELMDLTPLPRNHIPKGLAEARNMFINEVPPFVLEGNWIDERPKNSWISADGLNSPGLLPVQFVPRKWDNDHCYYTVDMNGTRSILIRPPGIELNGCVGQEFEIWEPPHGHCFEDQPEHICSWAELRAMVALSHRLAARTPTGTRSRRASGPQHQQEPDKTWEDLKEMVLSRPVAPRGRPIKKVRFNEVVEQWNY